jgi:hypothetical protein
VREKRRKVRKVHKYIMNGARILSDEGYIAGNLHPDHPLLRQALVRRRHRALPGPRPPGARRPGAGQHDQVWLAEMAMRFDIEKPIVTPEHDRRPRADVGRTTSSTRTPTCC